MTCAMAMLLLLLLYVAVVVVVVAHVHCVVQKMSPELNIWTELWDVDY